jgi:hypothetical protein
LLEKLTDKKIEMTGQDEKETVDPGKWGGKLWHNMPRMNKGTDAGKILIKTIIWNNHFSEPLI